MKLAYRRDTLLETTGGSFSGLQVPILISVLTLFLIILRFYSAGGCNRTGSYYLFVSDEFRFDSCSDCFEQCK